MLIPLTFFPASPITYLFIPKAPYLLGATTGFNVVMNSVHIAVSHSHVC